MLVVRSRVGVGPGVKMDSHMSAKKDAMFAIGIRRSFGILGGERCRKELCGAGRRAGLNKQSGRSAA